MYCSIVLRCSILIPLLYIYKKKSQKESYEKVQITKRISSSDSWARWNNWHYYISDQDPKFENCLELKKIRFIILFQSF